MNRFRDRLGPWAVSAALGVALGVACLMSIGGVVLIAGSVAVLALMTRRGQGQLFRWALWALGLRWLLILAITFIIVLTGQHYPGGTDTAPALFGDEGYYTAKAWWILKRIVGLPLEFEELIEVNKEYYATAYGLSAHVYPMTFFYALFGYSPTAVKGISALLGVVTGIMVHDLVRVYANPRAAKLAAVLVWFWPSLVLWSVTNLKDPYAIFLLVAAVWAFQRCLTERKWIYALVAAGAVYGYAMIKAYLWVAVVASMALAWVLQWRRRWLRWAAAGAAALCLAAVVVRAPGALPRRIEAGMRRIAMFHVHQALQQPDTLRSYRLLPDRCYQRPVTDERFNGLGPADYAKMAVSGVGYFLTVPWPVQLTSVSRAAVIPQMLCWYLALLAVMLGVWRQVRQGLRPAALALFVLSGVTLMLALTEGNIGTAFRHRDLVAPFYLLFAAIGATWAWDRRQAQRPPSVEPVREPDAVAVGAP